MNVEKISLIKQSAKTEAGTGLNVPRAKLSEAAQDTVTLSSKPAFTGNVKPLLDYIPAQKTINFLNKHLEPLRGEVGSIAITALGTGAVAPIFIAFNPFVKAPKDATEEQKQEVKNNKAYTAMRQPISAILAAIFQIGALKPIDKYLDKQFNEADKAKKFAVDIDQSLVNNKSYLKNLIKKEMKEEVKTGKAVFATEKEFNTELEKRIAQRTETQLQNVAKQLEETGNININGRKLSNKHLANIINDNIDNYIKSVQGHIVDKDGLNFYNQRAKDLINNENYFKEVLSDVKLPKNNVKSYINNLIKEAPNDEAKKILTEIARMREDLIQSRCQRTIQRIDKIKNMCGGTYSAEAYNNYLNSNNKLVKTVIENLEELKIKNIENMNPTTVKETLKKLAETCTYDGLNNKAMHNIFHDTETIQTNLKTVSKKVFRDVANSYKTFLDHGYKGVNTILKMMIGIFITLPITCTALNWVYPRAMELFFPKLAGVKKEGGNK